MLKFHMVIGIRWDFFSKGCTCERKQKMADELQKYKDILKREWEEFKKQLVREVSTSKFLLFWMKIDSILN